MPNHVDELPYKVHKIKCIQPYYEDVRSGRKNFELRFDDRNYQVGDRLDIYEGDKSIHPDFELRPHIHKFIIYKLTGGKFGLQQGYCILGLADEPNLINKKP